MGHLECYIYKTSLFHNLIVVINKNKINVHTIIDQLHDCDIVVVGFCLDNGYRVVTKEQVKRWTWSYFGRV